MYLADRPVARSVYVQQVQQIFPFQLVGRNTELAELEAFCTRPDSGSYVWWQGPAWAGKSALMAWFVLHPPTGVRVVSFFITARFAGQSDRTAFLEVMLEQLAEVARQPMPDALTESNQQAWFGQLLHDAAVACEENQQRLVLVVDGLDEDRGVTSSPDAHSIAALLPAAPPAGLRVIVAGRPDPPVPVDVPPWHPLRDNKIVRPLSVSPHAQMVRDDAERELDHLLDDPGLGRKLLGLVTVARGGLSRDDLAELSGEPPRTVDRTLRSVLGRTFYGRLNRWRVSAPPVFVLAHEELQQAAEKSLARDELAGFLGQLHVWADQYRQRGWPAETPEYLLRGYHRLLVATGDIERMTEMATDRARLDRMLDVSGGDAAALAEITAAQEFICSQHQPRTWPPCYALPSLATGSPSATATFHLPYRQSGSSLATQHALKRSPGPLPTRPGRRRRWPVWQGHWRRPVMSTGRVVPPSRPRPSPGPSPTRTTQTRALADVAQALARAGDADRAEAVARSITDPYEQTRALADVAQALARAGDADRAEAVARSITDPLIQELALADMAQALARAGDVGPGRGRRPVRSPTRPGRHGRWRVWRGCWQRPVMSTGRVEPPSKPRPSHVRSPTRPGRQRRWPA